MASLRRSLGCLFTGLFYSALIVIGGAYLLKNFREDKEIPKQEVPQSHDQTSNLNRTIENIVVDSARSGRTEPLKNTSWLFQQIKDDGTLEELASINENVPRQAASMIKPFIALAFYHEVSQGRFNYGPASKARLDKMLKESDNVWTNYFIRLIGGPDRVQSILTNNYGHIFKDTTIKDYIPLSAGERRSASKIKRKYRIGFDIPSGINFYANTASAADYGRFYTAIWTKKLPYSADIFYRLAGGENDRITSSKVIPDSVKAYRKSGTSARCIGDGGIGWFEDQNGGRQAFVMVGIVEDSNRHPDYRWKGDQANLIRDVGGAFYQEVKRPYNLR